MPTSIVWTDSGDQFCSDRVTNDSIVGRNDIGPRYTRNVVGAAQDAANSSRSVGYGCSVVPRLVQSPRVPLIIQEKHSLTNTLLLGVMGEHVARSRGEWMVEYKYMNMYMEDNRHR